MSPYDRDAILIALLMALFSTPAVYLIVRWLRIVVDDIKNNYRKK